MSLHPMFSYFGSKYRLGKYYPEPRYRNIIEPFAGSAGYSLRYPDRQVLLYETYKPLVTLWEYLIDKNTTRADILSLPLGPFDKDHPVSTLDIPEGAKLLLGFWLTESQTSASRYPLSKSRGGNWNEAKRQRIADQIEKIKHWVIHEGSYRDDQRIGNVPATWFIDPPYEAAGKRYRHNEIDYTHLAEWSKRRLGQCIVCEQEGAQWLPFDLLKPNNNGSNRTYHEVVWYGGHE